MRFGWLRLPSTSSSRAELAAAGARVAVTGEALHSHRCAVGEHGAVDEPEAAVADDVVRGEAPSGGGEVGEREQSAVVP